ncbi:MAG: SRPBCC family protein [Vampirovibrionia bacterium]
MNFFKTSLLLLIGFFFIVFNTNAIYADVPNVSLTAVNGVKTVNATTVINAPTNVVWNVITNYNQFTSFMPGIKQFNIIQNSGNTKKANVKLDVSKLMKAFSYQATISENFSRKNVTMVRTSGDLNSLKLTFSLKPMDNGSKTLLTYTVNVDHGNGIPNGFANRALKNNITQTLKAVTDVSLKNYANTKLASK